MKKLTIIFILFLFCLSCEKEAFDVNHPDVEKFVRQLKKGTYNNYEMGVDGEKLWTIMPNFNKKHIPLLISLSQDTALVCPCDHFPVNPISSIPPYRVNNGNECIVLGEYLLWSVEGIIQSTTFPSLVPILVSDEYSDERLSGKEILEARKLYQEWWELYGNAGDPNKLPLDGTVYRWK
jgi:hypothetical protein